MSTEQTQGYKFIQYPYNCEYGSSANVLIEHTIVDRDVGLTEMLETFEHFLRASGFLIDGRVDIVCDEERVDVPVDLSPVWTVPPYTIHPQSDQKSNKPDAGFVMGADG